MTDTLRLREGAVESILMDDALAAAITRERIAQVSPLGGGVWQVSNVARVGAVRLEGVEVRVEPKVPIRNLFHLLARGRSWGDWWPDDLKLDDAPDFSTVIAEAFLAHSTRALQGGVLHGYVEKREAASTIRGRILMGEQIRRRTGVPLPVELQYDDFTADIAVNQYLRSAARRLIGAGRLRERVRSGLLRLDLALAEASLLTRGAQLPIVLWDRRNERYRSAVALAQLILTNGSLDHRVGGTIAKGFLLTLSKVFEEFVEAEVTRSAARWGGRIVAQERTSLDVEDRIRIAPDLVWRDSTGPRAVFDAKYKAEKPSGFPNADIYQMIVYCIRLGLDTGHLMYAAGNEDPARYEIRNSGVTVVCHALRLQEEPKAISAQVDRIVADAFHLTGKSSAKIGSMAECRHGLEEELCGTCGAASRHAREQVRSRAGQTFALIYAPSINSDTFLHLNRQGDSWKIRHYSSPNQRADEVAQSSEKRTRWMLDLDQLEIVHELAYPYSTSPLGVSIEDHRYWFDEIAKANAKYLGRGV